MPTETMEEAQYLTAIINSDALWQALIPLAPKNWAGNSRHVQKHIWRLPIPEFNPHDQTHLELAQAGREAALGATAFWREVKAERQRKRKSISSRAARSQINQWLAQSPEGQRVEDLAMRILEEA